MTMKVDMYRGWTIWYSSAPSPLWTATKGMEKDLYSYVGKDSLKRYIDVVEDEESGGGESGLRVHG
jgi:hypothetical protein